MCVMPAIALCTIRFPENQEALYIYLSYVCLFQESPGLPFVKLHRSAASPISGHYSLFESPLFSDGDLKSETLPHVPIFMLDLV